MLFHEWLRVYRPSTEITCEGGGFGLARTS